MSANQIAGAICITVILFFAWDILLGETVHFQGKVVDGFYTPEQKHVRHDKNGSHTTTDPEKWELIVLTSNNAYKVRSEPFMFYKVKNGDIVTCESIKGFFSNTLYRIRAIDIVKKQY